MADPSSDIHNVFQQEGRESIEQNAEMLQQHLKSGQAKVLRDATRRVMVQADILLRDGGAPVIQQSDMLAMPNAFAVEMLSMLLDSDQIADLEELLQEQAQEQEQEGEREGPSRLPAIQDMFGRTPLHYAAKTGNAIAARQLLEKLPSILLVRDDAGQTAHDIAIHWSRKAVHKVLRKFDSKPSPSAVAVGDGDGLHDGANVRADGDGGWSPKVDEEATISRCDIDERANLTAEEFYNQYVAYGRL
jgi:hypothetical protein